MWQIYLNCHQKMGILNLKKRVNRDKCSFTTKQRMFGVFAIDEILRYRWCPLAGSRTLCHPVNNTFHHFTRLPLDTGFTNLCSTWWWEKTKLLSEYQPVPHFERKLLRSAAAEKCQQPSVKEPVPSLGYKCRTKISLTGDNMQQVWIGLSWAGAW